MAEARELEKDAATQAGIRETVELGAIKASRAKELRTAAKALNQSVRLEDIVIGKSPITQSTKKGIGSITAGYAPGRNAIRP
jgi:hypothetical protein